LPPTRFGVVGRLLLASGRLNLLVAPKTRHDAREEPDAVDAEVARGRYLANIAGCHGCHGFGLSGGRVAGPPDLPPAANLTPTALSAWTESDFVTAMREGRRPDGRQLDEFMPWRQFAAMTDPELHALWAYIRSVPPRADGLK
jgi:mono/diheme cytochrome c family protein